MGKDTEFLEAARSGNITLVEKILNQRAKWTGPLASLRRGPGANVQDNSGYSALHHATLNGHNDVVKLLLAHDASPNLPDIRGSSPLHLAAWAGHQEIVKLFLTHPNRQANPNLQTVDNETPLHFAAQHGHTGALTTLLAHGADPNVTNNRNETPLDLAAQYGRLQVVQMLIRAHPELLDPFKADTTTGSSIDGGGYSGGDSSTGSNTSISRANRQCPHRNMIRSHSPLHLASRNGHKNVVEVLLAAGVNVNLLTTAGTALHEAALCGKDSVVRTLLDFGADLDATDCENRTALNILEEFPPHVTKGIVSVINNHRNSILYDSESDDLRDYNSHSSSVQYHHRQRFQDYQHKQYRNNHNCFGNSLHQYVMNIFTAAGTMVPWFQQQRFDVTISPSSSMGSLGPPSPHQRASNGDLSSDFYVPMEPSKKFKTTAPKKPPRRNLSISPTHAYGSGQAGGGGGRDGFMSVSVDGGYPAISNRSGGSGSDTSSKHYPQTIFDKYEYIYLAHSGNRQNGERNAGRRIQRQQQQNDTDYIQMMPKPEPRNTLTHSYENTTFKSYNPNRKLRRNRDNCYEQFSVDLIRDTNKDYSMSAESVGGPPSPTHYQQPPTPEHPPPSAVQAETFIHESIRPLSQEYKRRSVGHFPQQKQQRKNPSNLTMESGTSSSEPLYQSLCASSGSLSSSISISDRSVSTDCVEEFIGDVPFAGLFKGSTITLNNFGSNYPLQPYQRYQQGNNYLNSNASSGKSYNTSSPGYQKELHERPRTLCTQEQLQPYLNDPRFEYQQSRSLSFGGIVTNNLNNDDDDTLRERQHSFSADDRNDGQLDDDLLRHQQYHHDRNSDDQKIIGVDRKIASISSDLKSTANVISPFDEDEAWAKISEIMQSFGSGILSTTTQRKMGECDDDDDDDDDTAISEKDHLDNNATIAVDGDGIIRNEDGAGENSNNGKYLSLRQFLMVCKLQHLENILMENGFDRVEHLNGILDETDLNSMNISLQPDGSNLLDAIQKLPTTSSLLISEKQQRQHKQNNNNNNSISILNVDQWLQTIHLSEYGDIFKRHLCTNLDGGVCRVWEAELQTVLEIQKIGHRKRILHSISSNRTLPITTTAIMSDLNTELNTPEVNIMNISENLDQKSQNQRNEQQQQQQGREGKPLSNIKHNKKNRPAPKPPIRATLLEIRAPSELLLGLPSNLRTQWRHPANVLITSAVTYDVFYLGSTVVKELRGTESTRKSIQKLKRDNHSSCHSNIHFTSDGRSSITEPNKPFQQKQLIRLSISHRGVEFINTELKSTICEHEIRNIHCACQDADDLSHFAYITKDADINIHYCHVFNADSMDLATEIILTLGQAFEVAYQLALRDSTQNTQFNRKAVVDVIK